MGWECNGAPGPFNFRGCDLTEEWLPATQVFADGHHPGAIPGNRTNRIYRLRVSTRPSLQNSAHSGRHGGSLPISTGAWQKSDAPALQAGTSGSVTRRPPPFSNAAVAEIERHSSSKRTHAGANPAGSAIARWCQSSTTVC